MGTLVQLFIITPVLSFLQNLDVYYPSPKYLKGIRHKRMIQRLLPQTPFPVAFLTLTLLWGNFTGFNDLDFHLAFEEPLSNLFK